MKLRTGLLAAAAVCAMTAGYTGSANADAYAVAVLNITNFTVSGIPPFNGAANTFTLQKNEVDLGAAHDETGPNTETGAAASTNDIGAVCLGDGCPIAENALTTLIGDNANTHFARADSHMLDTIINFEPTDTAKTGEFGSSTESRSKGQVASASTSGPDHRMTWTFTMPDAMDEAAVAVFSYDGELIFEFVREAFGDFVALTSNLTIEIRRSNGTLVGNNAGQDDDVLNASIAIVNDVPGSGSASTGNTAFAPTITIPTTEAGNTLRLNIVFSTTVAADAVPEPVTLGLLGAGLLGLGLAARRRKQTISA